MSLKRSGESKGLQIAGIVVCVLTIVFAIWMGLGVCLYGGVVSILTGFASDPWLAGMIAWGVVKVLCTGIVAWLSFACGWGLGLFLMALGEGR